LGTAVEAPAEHALKLLLRILLHMLGGLLLSMLLSMLWGLLLVHSRIKFREQ